MAVTGHRKWRTIWILARRELRSSVYGLGLYLTMFGTMVIIYYFLKNYLGGVQEDRILITSSPLDAPLFLAMGISSIYLAIAASLSIAREKDRNTIEVLFYGPINYLSFILGKYLKGILEFLIIAAFFVLYFIAFSLLTNLGISFGFVQTLILSLFLASYMISFGVLLSTLTNNVRNTVLVFLGVMLGLVAIQLSYTVLDGMKLAASSSLAYIRDTLEVLLNITKWVSPYYYFTRGMDAISLGSGRIYLINTAFYVVLSAIFLGLSMFSLQRKGVKG
jgi:ABC-type transport system involved in multi-copper enzyme maturation permease subunit